MASFRPTITTIRVHYDTNELIDRLKVPGESRESFVLRAITKLEESLMIERTVVDMDFIVTDAEIQREAGNPFSDVTLRGMTRSPCNVKCFDTPNRKFRLKLVEVLADDDATVVST